MKTLFGDDPGKPSGDPSMSAPHNGTAASREGAEIAPATKQRQRQEVLAAIRRAGEHGRTCQELAELIGCKETAINGRTNELKDQGLVRLGDRRKSNLVMGQSKIRHQRWVAV